MNRMIITAGALAGMLASTPALAETVDGNRLYEFCTQPANRHSCEHYVGGLVEGWQGAMEFVRGTDGDNIPVEQLTAEHMMTWAFEICPPENNTLGQGLDIVLKHLREYPQVRSNSAAFETMKALFLAWPCKGE
jgi:Rap1a immunity proteins